MVGLTDEERLTAGR